MANVQERWTVSQDQEGEIDGGVSAGKPVATPDDRVTSPVSAGSSKEEDSNRLEQHNLITGDAIKMNIGRERSSKFVI